MTLLFSTAFHPPISAEYTEGVVTAREEKAAPCDSWPVIVTVKLSNLERLWNAIDETQILPSPSVHAPFITAVVLVCKLSLGSAHAWQTQPGCGTPGQANSAAGRTAKLVEQFAQSDGRPLWEKSGRCAHQQ